MLESLKVKELLGIHNDCKLNLNNSYRDYFFRKSRRKLNTLSRIAIYMELPNRRILMNRLLKLNLTIALLFGCFTAVV